MAATASRAAPGRHDATWTLAVKLSSAIRVSLAAGHPNPAMASLLTKVRGTTVSWPVATDATSS